MTFPGPPVYSVNTFPYDVVDRSFTGEPEARGFVTLPEDEAVRRPRENILEAQVEAALQKHELGEFLPVEDDYHPLAYEAYCSKCGVSFYISPEGVYSIFQGYNACGHLGCGSVIILQGVDMRRRGIIYFVKHLQHGSVHGVNRSGSRVYVRRK